MVLEKSSLMFNEHCSYHFFAHSLASNDDENNPFLHVCVTPFGLINIQLGSNVGNGHVA